jgi:hypothetical protein
MPSAVRTILFVLLAALAATSVLASPLLGVLSATRTKTTNADLLARGQTPKRPKQLFNPSRPRGESRASVCIHLLTSGAASLPRQSSVPAQNAAIQITPYYDGVPARRTEKRDTAPARFVQVDTQNGNIFAVRALSARFAGTRLTPLCRAGFHARNLHPPLLVCR